jgi:hypothetical protein
MNSTTADRLKAAITAAVESLNQQDARPKFSELTVITYTHATFLSRRDVLAVRIAPVLDDFAYGGQTIKAPDVAVQVAAALAFEIAAKVAEDMDDGYEISSSIEDAAQNLTVGFDYANDDGAILYFPNIPA